MTRFAICLDRVLKHEGGFVDHPKDPGGATNMGITRDTLSDWLKRPATVDEVKDLSRDTAAGIYRARYWSPILADGLPTGVDYMLFDLAVNSGVGRAAKFLQLEIGVTPDGKIGPVTLGAAMKKDPKGLVLGLSERRENFFRALPTFATFGKGWIRRLRDVTRDALKDAE
ncbi:glycosyl hydrolase 108 family protein [Phenylobacterium sp.]|uniref:glycoside hydrolase family 108 protein n=1 Tax=Phenylobacterium sp. TaxID=1871053 RepID=UPI0025F895C1|nr:glycosyl hydrolase 108 family protein [Phenylobacterium sp.]MCA6264154.1 glycoside hydrolase family 108 protein [Phenylobacterium sp.]MCA6281384.1 glycoside hydrolase family 108 protein [Phenylobacterium sp.]MCA6301209.1 glycoside hydrolase family 108 protein [Phenylobacterium sp.]